MKNVTFYKFDVEPEKGMRLDQLIALQLPEYSRSRIKNWMNAEKVLITGLKTVGGCGSGEPPPPPPPQDTRIIVNNRLKTIL